MARPARAIRGDDSFRVLSDLSVFPTEVAFSERHENKAAALQRECQLERWTRDKKEALVSGDLDRLRRVRRSGRD